MVEEVFGTSKVVVEQSLVGEVPSRIVIELKDYSGTVTFTLQGL